MNAHIQPCPAWHKGGKGCYQDDLFIAEGWWEPFEFHCPGCCPEGLGKDDD